MCSGEPKSGSAQFQLHHQPFAPRLPCAKKNRCSFAGDGVVKDIAFSEHNCPNGHKSALYVCRALRWHAQLQR